MSGQVRNARWVGAKNKLDNVLFQALKSWELDVRQAFTEHWARQNNCAESNGINYLAEVARHESVDERGFPHPGVTHHPHPAHTLRSVQHYDAALMSLSLSEVSSWDPTCLEAVHCVAITVLVLRFLLSHINHLISNWVQRNPGRWHCPSPQSHSIRDDSQDDFCKLNTIQSVQCVTL